MPRDDLRFGLRTRHKLSTAENFRESVIVGKLGVRNRLVRLDFFLDAATVERLEVYWGQADTMIQASDDQKLYLLPFNSGSTGRRETFTWAVGSGPVSIIPESLSIRRQIAATPPGDNFYWTVWYTEERQ